MLTFWNEKRYPYFVQRFELVSKEHYLSFHFIELNLCVFRYQKQNRNGWQWQSSIKHCGISHIQWWLLMGNLWYCIVQEIVPINTLTTKNTFSNVLFALVYANYNFMFVDAVCQGRISDIGIFTNTELYKKTRNKILLSSSAGPSKWERKKCSVLFYWR